MTMTSDTSVILPSVREAPELPTPYELGSMSTQQLRSELARSLTMSAKHLVYLAALWSELEKRGEDLSDLRTGLAAYLPLIAAGRLDADAVIRFAGQPTVLRNIATLPIEQQYKLAMGEPVKVLTVGSDGSYTHAELPAYGMTAAQARLVFDAGKVRSPKEQEVLLESARVTAKRRARPGPEGRVRYDPKTDQIRVGGAKASVGEIVSALTQAAQPQPEGAPEPDKPIVIKLTETEHRMFKARAAEAGVDMQAFGRALLMKFAVL